MFLKGELFFIVGIFIDDETIDDNIRMNKILLKTTIIFTALFLSERCCVSSRLAKSEATNSK